MCRCWKPGLRGKFSDGCACLRSLTAISYWTKPNISWPYTPNTYTGAYTDLLLHLSTHMHSAAGWMYQQGPDDGTLLSVPGCWMPPLRALTAWCSWPHFNDLNHLMSTATHFSGLTEFILVDRDQCPQPWMLPDYSRRRDLSDWHDWIQLSALILLLIPPLWLWPWGQMSGMER